MTERKTESQPMPKSLSGLLALLKSALALPRVDELRVTPKEVVVTRRIAAGETVWEKLPDLEPDPVFLVENIERLEMPVDPERHPWHQLFDAMAVIQARRLSVMFVCAPAGGLFAAELGLDEDPEWLMGYPVHYTSNPLYAERAVIVGGTSPYLEDASLGVLITLGVLP